MSRTSARTLLVTSALALAACRGRGEGAVPPGAIEIPQPPVELGEVWGPEHEAHTREIQRIFHDILIADTGDDPLMRRDAHPKHHACVKGTLRVDPSALRPEHRAGLFAGEGEYQAWVRFSNGDSDPKLDDIEPNFRGMAIKIMQVPYSSYLADVGVEADNPVHDLVLLNSPTFFIHDTDEYAQFMRAVAKGGASLVGFSLAHGKNIRIIQRSRKMKVGNMLDLDYHSATPYKLGSTSMRMMMQSCKEAKDERPEEPTPNFLGERLEASLAERSHCFVFYVQPNEDPERNPVEDPRRAWDLEASPRVEVGRLTLLQQPDARSPARMQMCEQVSFNPWRAPAANRPLGQANRVRLEVYTLQSRLRHDHNGAQEARPTSFADGPP